MVQDSRMFNLKKSTHCTIPALLARKNKINEIKVNATNVRDDLINKANTGRCYSSCEVSHVLLLWIASNLNLGGAIDHKIP